MIDWAGRNELHLNKATMKSIVQKALQEEFGTDFGTVEDVEQELLRGTKSFVVTIAKPVDE